jgi:hypothetical protein
VKGSTSIPSEQIAEGINPVACRFRNPVHNFSFQPAKPIKLAKAKKPPMSQLLMTQAAQ